MKDLFTILWDPHGSGEYQFYDRIFYIDPSCPLERISKEFVGDLFRRAIVVKVSFSQIS